MPDKRIHCVGCKGEFIWSEGEQTYFETQGLKYPPKRCRACRQEKRNRQGKVEEFGNAWKDKSR